MTACIHCFITGRVQGVFFRASTRTEALRLGLKGHAKNLPDGRVEVIACGEKTDLAKLQAWLKHGPKMAEVTHLELIPCNKTPAQQAEGFLVL